MSTGYSLSDLQRMKEELEIGRRLQTIAREHRMREVLGDDVYDFVRADRPVQVDPVARAHEQIRRVHDFVQKLLPDSPDQQ
jgi:archaeosine-15-forming tRNA-guanine transglycosylase